MVVLIESGTLDHKVLGVFKDRETMLAEVASAEPTAELENFKGEYISIDTPFGYRNILGFVQEFEEGVYYG